MTADLIIIFIALLNIFGSKKYFSQILIVPFVYGFVADIYSSPFFGATISILLAILFINKLLLNTLLKPGRLDSTIILVFLSTLIYKMGFLFFISLLYVLKLSSEKIILDTLYLKNLIINVVLNIALGTILFYVWKKIHLLYKKKGAI